MEREDKDGARIQDNKSKQTWEKKKEETRGGVNMEQAEVVVGGCTGGGEVGESGSGIRQP